MNLKVDPILKQAVINFAWPEPLDAVSPDEDLEAVVKDIYKNILTAENVQLDLGLRTGQPFLRLETCYLIAQNNGGNDTLNKIQQATDVEKNYLNRAFKMLSTEFVRLPPNDLKEMTLLFGISRISALFANKISLSTPQKRDEIESILVQLKAIRGTFSDIENLPLQQQLAVMKIDAHIADCTDMLETLK